MSSGSSSGSAASSDLSSDVKSRKARLAVSLSNDRSQGRSGAHSSDDDVLPSIDLPQGRVLQKPKRKLKQFNPILTYFGKGVWVVFGFHLFAAAAFVYFNTKYISTLQGRFSGVKNISLDACYSVNNSQIITHALTPVDVCFCFQYGKTTERENLIDRSTLGNLLEDQSQTCSDFISYYAVLHPTRNTTYTNGVYVYAFFNGIYGAVAPCLLYFFFFPRLKRLEPKSYKTIIADFLLGFHKGTFMVSYAWKDEPAFFKATEGLLPRRVASFFPCSWLDIENLIPGSHVQNACADAARNARFRFAFVSKRYFESPNCQVEWKVIRKEPGKCFIFAYDEEDIQSELEELTSMGHIVYKMDEDNRHEFLTPEFHLGLLVKHGILMHLFGFASPAINQDWYATLRFWFGEADFSYLFYSTPFIFFPLSLGFIDIFVGWYWGFLNIMRGNEGIGILYACCLVVPVLVFFLGFYLVYFLQGTGFKQIDLPDVALLLKLLNGMGIIDPVKFYSNSDDVTEKKEFQEFMDTGVLEVVEKEDKEDAVIKVWNLDVEDDPEKSDDYTVDSSYVLWTRMGFVSLSQSKQATFGSYLIGDSVPNVEFLATKIMVELLKLNSEHLTVGVKSFKTLFIKQGETK